MSKRYLVTGGAGFIGSNFIRWLLSHDDDARVTNLDNLAFAGVHRTVDELNQLPGHTFVEGDIRNESLLAEIVPGHDAIIHLAAETHVDRSITHPGEFLSTNIVGTGVLIDAAYKSDVPRFLHVSTDEVYGSISVGAALESDALAPSSPYSASKAGSDLLVRSYEVTYGYAAVVTRCTNNFGPYQFPEKLIPLFVTNLIDGRPIPVYGDGRNERDWLYVDDHCAALHLLLNQGQPGEIYNIGSGEQRTNLAVTDAILQSVGRDQSFVEYVEDRPGHDRRYAVDSSKLRALGWRPQGDFEERLEETIAWYVGRDDWWRPLRASA